MNLRASIAITVCKGLRLLARILHRGGTAKPGEIALKICPQLLSILSRDVKTIAITGTNGKTTSARMVEQAFIDAGLDYIANRSGANLISGITTEFALKSSIFGKCRVKYAVIECDEAASRRSFAQLKPAVVLVTNLFRDQLDRFGEVTATLDCIREGLSKVPETIICLNADESLSASLALDLPNPTFFYGFAPSVGKAGQKPTSSDMQSCIRCGGKYDYDYLTFGHMGGFRCPRCGYARPDTRLSVSSILSKDMDSSRILIDMDGTEYPVRVNLPAEYNIYNAAGAIAALTAMDFDPRQAIAAVEGFRCGFGRMERFDSIGSAGACMMLVKNPTGCSQVLEFISALDQECCVVLCINDRSGDGTDVSWLWDVEFEKLAAMGSKLDKVIVSGIRAADMWARLKYAGIPDEHISLERDYDALAQKLGNMDKPIFIIPTYSAMMDCRAALVKHYGGAQFWEG